MLDNVIESREYENPWFYQGLIFTSDMINDHVGFVYIITNRLNGKKYIGKKTFFNTKRIKVKNRKNRKVKKLESDWKCYYGSSPLLQKDIDQFGKLNFSREILHLCKTKSMTSYLEAKEQIITDCLLKEDYYNTWITVKVHRPGLNKK